MQFLPFFLPKNRPPTVLGANLPDRSIGHSDAGVAHLVGDEPIAELRFVAVRVDHGVCDQRLVPPDVGGPLGEPPIEQLTSKYQQPDTKPDRYSIDGQLAHEREDYFPGRFACDR